MALGRCQGNAKPYPRWQGTETARLLSQDIDNDRNVLMKPRYLKNTRPQFGPFPGKVFRDHIYQETRKREGRNYWLARNAEIEALKEKGLHKKKKPPGPPPKPLY